LRSSRVRYELGVILAVSLIALSGSADGASRAGVRCPLKSSSAIPSGDAWAFHETGVPSTPHPGITSSYIHGRGDWGGGHGSGTICQENRSSTGPSRDIVLTIAGSSHVSPGITRLGHPGAGLALDATVAASSDPRCSDGTHATVTIFASYYEGHHDSVQLHFAGGCTPYDATFLGSQLYALIAENGHQVN